MIVQQLNTQEDISAFTTISKYNDDTWILDNLHTGSGTSLNKIKLFFARIPEEYKSSVKEYAINKLTLRRSTNTIQRNITGLTMFFKWLVTNKYKLDKNIHYDYCIYLRSLHLADSTKEARWEAISDYLQLRMPNPFMRTVNNRAARTRYIPKDKIIKIDKLFKDENIPHYLRTVYWLLRLIPSRIGEITSLPINPYIDCGDMYCITLNMFKQNGGYVKSALRQVYLLKDDVGNYIVDLINKQRLLSLELQDYLDEKNKGYLFTYVTNHYYRGRYVYHSIKPDNICILTEDIFANFLRELPKRYGDDYKFTSHQLRHNAIANRLAYGFTPTEIQSMTKHNNTKMLVDNYSNYTEQDTLKISTDVNKSDLQFHGRIINNTMEDILLKRPNTKVIDGLGICSNDKNCRKDT